VNVSPVLAELGTYPFVRLDEAKRLRVEQGTRVIDFGVGDPREPTAPRIRQALADGIRETMSYPRAHGLAELREAVAAWVARRFGVTLDPEREIIPTLGSKEAICSFAQVVLDPGSGRDAVVVTEPGYPVAERGTRFAGGSVVHLPLREHAGFLPDIDAVDAAVWRRAAVVWTNYPNNPTGATAPRSFYRRLAELAAEHDFLIAADEAYSELWFEGDPPVSALETEDRSRIVVFNSLSKRSSMTGYRCGFVAAPLDVIDALRLFRPTVGTAPQEFVQRAAVAAWTDEEHVTEARERYRRKRAVLMGAIAGRGLRIAASVAGMYLWVDVPDGESSEAFALRLLHHGILVAPGSYLGPSGEGYARFALVPTEDECKEAAQIIEDTL
jgi:N-succinyldiaminopimelate aminotransferase